jgi:YD repeat-containing protein
LRETKTYDAAGNIETRTDFPGRTTTCDYDLNHRLVTKTYPDSTNGDAHLRGHRPA